MMRWGVLIAIPLILLAGALIVGPIPQSPAYHGFADGQAFYGIPNFANVVSNLAFLLFGGIGLRRCLRQRPDGALAAWTFFFLAFVVLGFGSAYYHWAPANGTLVVDRLAMTLAFAGLYVALLSEYVDERVEKALLLPAALIGIASVLYWDWTGDLAPYFAFQGTMFVSVAVILLGFNSLFGQKGFILWALILYAIAIAFEQLDHRIFTWTLGATGGHAIKHVFAGLAAVPLYMMLSRRPPIPHAAAVEDAIGTVGDGAEARESTREG